MRSMHSLSSKLKKLLDWNRRAAQGFSLIELMVAMGASLILMAAIYGIHAIQTRSYTTQNVAADVQQAVRAGVDFMAEDIMMAGLNPEETADAGIQNAASDEIRFTLDRNMDGDCSDNFEDITYRLNGGSLEQISPSLGTQTMLDNVTALTFSYLDEDGNTTGTLNEIRTVIISMTVEEPAGRDGLVTRTYSTRVRCRNLGL